MPAALPTLILSPHDNAGAASCNARAGDGALPKHGLGHGGHGGWALKRERLAPSYAGGRESPQATRAL